MSALTVVVTRAREQSQEFSRALEANGFEVIQIPSIQFTPVEPDIRGEGLLRNLIEGKFGWLVFTSRNGVETLATVLRGKGDLKTLLPKKLNIAAQGDRTALRVKEIFGRASQRVPLEFVGEALVDEFIDDELDGIPVLIVGAQENRGVVAAGLKEKGAALEELVLYKTVGCEPDRSLMKDLVARDPSKVFFTFFSPSAFRNFMETLSPSEVEFVRKARVVSIGPVTSKVVREAGYVVFKEAVDHSEEGMIKALV